MKYVKALQFIIAALAVTACSSNDDSQIDDSTTVVATFTANIQKNATRASGTTWDADDAIGITASDNSDMVAKYNNVKYITTGDGNFTGDPIYYQNVDLVTFNAYYPYSATNGTIKGNTSADNQSTANQKKIDYLYASATGKSKSPNVTFTFGHCMSQIMLTFKQGDDVNLKDLTSYTIGGLKLQGTFNTDNGVAEATDTAEDLKMSITGQNVETIAAPAVILYPQTAASFDLSVTLDGQTYTQKGIAISNSMLDAGNCYQYTITVSKNGLQLNQTSISGWNGVDAGSGTVMFQKD